MSTVTPRAWARVHGTGTLRGDGPPPTHSARRPSPSLVALTAAACHTPRPGGPGTGHGPPVRLNEVQVLASHNSYHVEPEPTLFSAAARLPRRRGRGVRVHPPAAGRAVRRRRAPDRARRVRRRPRRRALRPPRCSWPLLGLAPVDPAFAGPGLKVFHVQEVDYRSTCTAARRLPRPRCAPGRTPTPATCRSPSRSRPRTAPSPTPGSASSTPLPVDQADFAAARGRDRLRVPGRPGADPRRRAGPPRHACADAVRAGRWPRLDAGAGPGAVRARRQGRQAGRVPGRGARPRRPARLRRRPRRPTPTRRSWSSTTRSATPTASAPWWRPGSSCAPGPTPTRCRPAPATPTMRDAAFASGAQYVSTDYVLPDDRFGTGYVVDLPGDDGRPLQPGQRPAAGPSDRAATARGLSASGEIPSDSVRGGSRRRR